MLGLPAVVRSCQDLSVPGVASVCQGLPGAVMSFQDVPGVVRKCQEVELQGVARGCQELPGCARSCQGVPKVVRKCQDVPGVAAGVVWSSQYMLGLPGVVRS